MLPEVSGDSSSFYSRSEPDNKLLHCFGSPCECPSVHPSRRDVEGGSWSEQTVAAWLSCA